MTFPRVFSSRTAWLLCAALGVLIWGTVGCTALREVANLRKVQFEIDRVSQGQLAGIELSRLRSYEDLGTQEALRLGTALAQGTLPLSFTLHVRASNPSSNDVNARLTEMDWTLLLEEKETVSGTVEQEVVLSPGEPTDVPFDIELDLVRFFDENLRDFVNLAAALRGDRPPQSLKLKVLPTVTTKYGRIEYPSPITVVSRDVGREDEQR